MKRKIKYFLLISGLIFLSFEIAYCQSDGNENNISIETWMNEWMSEYKISGGVLHLTRFKDPVYILTRPITWSPDSPNSNFKPVTVPKGFVTDLASIPPFFFFALRPDGKYTHPAIVHDYLYWTQTVSRKEADEIFRIGLKEFDTGKIQSIGIYKAVRWGGGTAWNNNKKAKERGEKRILKKFPTDPKITWDEWRENPHVFK